MIRSDCRTRLEEENLTESSSSAEMRCIDARTEERLNQAAESANLVSRSHNSKPTPEELVNESAHPTKIKQLAIPTDGIVTIYKLNSGKTYNRLVEENTETIFAVDWNSQTHTDTFYFNQEPTKENIYTAKRIKEIKYAIEYSVVNQFIDCKHCSNIRHWTEVEGSEDLETAICLLLEDTCGCEEEAQQINLNIVKSEESSGVSNPPTTAMQSD